MIEVLAVSCSSPVLGNILSALRKMLGLIQIIGPLVLLVSLILTITKLMADPDNKKLTKKIINSVLAAVLLFFIPMFVNLVMNLLGEDYNICACWNSTNTSSGTSRYINTYDNRQKKSITTNPGDYEKGEKKQPAQSQSGSNGRSSSGNAASVDIGAHQLGKIVWDSSNVSRISNLSTTQLIAILNTHGGKARNFIPYAQAIITAERKYSVNAFFLIGIEAMESGWITSAVSRNCNNLGGVKATASHPTNGCSSSFGYFNSINEFIDYHAEMLHRSYLTPGGKFYEGTSPFDVQKHYCPGSSAWPVTVTKIGNSLFAHASSVQ